MSGFESIYPQHPDPQHRAEKSDYISNRDSAVSGRDDEAVRILDLLMKNRFSCRYYLPQPVDRKIVEEIIDAARFTPSGNNMQPWHKVYCFTGELKQTISRDMVEGHTTTPQAYSAEYLYYPVGPIPAEYSQRRYEFGKAFYGPLHVDHGDLASRARVSTRNYEFFDAPLAFIFTIHRGLEKGSWVDNGMFLQSVTLAARARGLETCTQEAPARYQLILRKYLPISEEEIVICGMSMGYPDLGKIHDFAAKQAKRETGEIVEFFGL